MFRISRVSERSACYNIYMAEDTGKIWYRKGYFSQYKDVFLVLLITWMSKFKNLRENYACLKYSKSHSTAICYWWNLRWNDIPCIKLSLNDMNRWWLITIYVFFLPTTKVNNTSRLPRGKNDRSNSGSFYVGSACIYQM